MSSIKPFADYVALIKEEAKKQTDSGFFLPEASQKDPKTAVVSVVGPEVKNVKTGDRVAYIAYGSVDVEIEGQEYLIVKEPNVIAKVG